MDERPVDIANCTLLTATTDAHFEHLTPSGSHDGLKKIMNFLNFHRDLTNKHDTTASPEYVFSDDVNIQDLSLRICTVFQWVLMQQVMMYIARRGHDGSHDYVYC